MPANSPSTNPASGEILRQLCVQLDTVEEELRQLGWWSEQPPDLLAEVAAGRLKSYLDAPSFELWLQCVFLPNARTRVAEADLPTGSSVGEMARRQYDFHSFVPEAQPLLVLLREFDDLIERYHRPPAAEPAPGPAPVANPVPPELAEMFATSRGLLLHWLNVAEDQLQRQDWWDADPDRPPVAFGQWMREKFVPEARASIRLGIVPAAVDLSGEARRRLAADGLTVPEEMVPILTNFDEGVNTYHSTWQLCGLPPPVPVPDTPATPPAHAGDLSRAPSKPSSRKRLAPAPPEPMGFEVVLEETRGLLHSVLDRIEDAVENLPAELPPPPGNEAPVEDWLMEEFLPDAREWLTKGQVPQESQVAVSARQEFVARGLLTQTDTLLDYLRAFDARVAVCHEMSLTFPKRTAGSRMAAAWRLVMATPELRTPLAPEPDAIRLQMLLTLNRIEAELHLLGWWCALPQVMPEPFRNTIEYSRDKPRDVDPPRFEPWLLASYVPEMRERVQASNIPDTSRIQNDAICALNEERLGKNRFQESRRLLNCFDAMETLMLKAWPAFLRASQQSRRRRGLTPPAASSGPRDEYQRFRDDVSEALRMAAYELKRLGWWGCDTAAVRALLADSNALAASGPPPFEHWLEAVFIPETRARLADGGLFAERRVSDYVAWECRHCGQSDAAKDLLTQLEKVDHWSSHANRARREMLQA